MSSQINLFADSTPVRLSDNQAELTLWSEFLAVNTADQMREDLFSSILWEQSVIMLYGKELLIPRLNAWYADVDCDYGYSGTRLTRNDWTPQLLALKQRVESRSGHEFNSVLVNCYRSGDDSMGWHSDDEAELGKNPVIASLSLGQTRRFLMRHRTRKNLPKIALELTHGSLLLMAGETQHYWQHSVPKSRVNSDMRINLTFRSIHKAL